MKERTIAFHPEVARALGDVESAIFYQQLYFWSDKGSRKDGFIYKTKDEIETETTLTREQQDRIRKKLLKLGWIEVKKHRANGAPTLHYKCLVDINITISGIPTNGNVEKPLMETRGSHESLTESTTENTPKNIIAPDGAEKNPVNKLLQVFYDGGNKSIRFQDMTQRKAAEWLLKELGPPSALLLAKKAMEILGDQYAPKAETPYKLKEKYLAVQKYGEKKKGPRIVTIT